MPALDNPRWEAFAYHVARGKTELAAYTEAGYNKPTMQAASKLLRRVELQKRVSELQGLMVARRDVTKERIIQELARIAFSDIRELATWNESGVTWKSSDQMTEEQSRVIAGVKQTMNEYGGTTELKLYDKQRALELLGKELGMFREKHDVQITASVYQMQIAAVMKLSKEELVKEAGEIVAREAKCLGE